MVPVCCEILYQFAEYFSLMGILSRCSIVLQYQFLIWQDLFFIGHSRTNQNPTGVYLISIKKLFSFMWLRLACYFLVVLARLFIFEKSHLYKTLTDTRFTSLLGHKQNCPRKLNRCLAKYMIIFTPLYNYDTSKSSFPLLTYTNEQMYITA